MTRKRPLKPKQAARQPLLTRREIHAYHAAIIAKEHTPTQWPPTRDLCVGGYRWGRKNASQPDAAYTQKGGEKSCTHCES